MKKTIALLLAALMLFGCSALAESTTDIKPAFTLTTITPDGYTALETSWLSPYIGVIQLVPQTEEKPFVNTVVSYNESASDVTFNDDMPQDEFEAYVKMVMVNPETGEEIPYTVQKTGLGTKVVIATHDNATELYTIWHGYEVSVYAFVKSADDVYSPVSDEQLNVIMQYLTDLDITSLISE